MFEVIISTVKTGRVERKGFASREAADCFINHRQEQWSQRNQSAQCYRIEVEYRAAPVAAPLSLPAAA